MSGWRSNWREEWRTADWLNRGERLLEQLRTRLGSEPTERRDEPREVHEAHQRVWIALDELLAALDQMPVPPPGRLADAISCAKDARDRNPPW